MGFKGPPLKACLPQTISTICLWTSEKIQLVSHSLAEGSTYPPQMTLPQVLTLKADPQSAAGSAGNLTWQKSSTISQGFLSPQTFAVQWFPIPTPL